jgi:tetratricopeptide (TPR) repeat protein
LMNKNTLAKEEWEATIKINPKHAPSYFNIGLLLKRKDPEKAFDKYRDAIDVDPNFVEAYYQWGLDLLNSGHFDEAITKFTEVTKRIKEKDDPLHLDALGMCGFALEKVGRKNDAIEKYNRIIMIAPNSEQAKKSRNSLLILKDDE